MNKSPAALEPWLEKQLGHPGKYVNLGVKPKVTERDNEHFLENPDKNLRPLSQNLSHKTYRKLRNREDNWGTIYRELTGFKKSNYGEATVEIDNRPVKYIGGAIKRYKNTYIRKKGSKAGISGRDLFKKREEIDYQDLIQGTWEGLYNLAGKHNPEKGSLSAYAYESLKWKIHSICKDPSWEENEIKRYAHVQSYSERGKSYKALAAEFGEEAFSDSFYEKLYREEARGNLEPKGNLEANLTEAASGGLDQGLDPFGRDIDTVKNGFNMRFQVAPETELTDRQKKILDLSVEGYRVRSAKESADVERILKWEPDLDGIKKRQILREKRKYEQILREKFPDQVQEPFDGENLENWDIYTSKKDLLEHLRKVEKRQKEESSDRIKAGFNFGKWPKDSANSCPIVYTNREYKPIKDKIDKNR